MKVTSVLGAACAVLLLGTACGGDDSEGATDEPQAASDGENADGSPDVDTDRKVVYYGTNVLSQWDPTKSTNQSNDVPYFTQVYDRLLQLQPDNTIRPALATEYEFSDDGLTLTMTLRDDVTFHDGSKFDAENAVANLERNRATGSILAPTLTAITGVAATGPNEIELTLAAPDPTVLFRLATTSSSMVSPLGLANPAALATAPAGSGPFKFVSYDGTTVKLERNDDYWDTDAVFPASKEIWAVTDDAARLNAVASGAADITTARATQWSEVQRLVQSGDVEAEQYGEMAQYMIYLNGTKGPLSDPDVRRAISMSIDRDLINEALLSGLCTPSSQPVPPGFIGHDDDSPDAHEFDPEAAQALLDEAGIEPFTVSQLVGDSGIHAQLGEVVAEQLAEIGITAELHPLPIQSLRAEWRTGNYDMLVFPTSPTTPDMISIALNDYLGPDGVKAEVPGLQKLVDEARPLEIGTDERKAALEEISALLFDEPLHVPICQVPGIYVYRTGILGADSVPGMLLSANVPDTRNVIWSP